MTSDIIIPTLNAGLTARVLCESLTTSHAHTGRVIVIDSASEDDTAETMRQCGALVIDVPRQSFRHGKTRNLAASYATSDILVFITQDVALRQADWLERLIAPIVAGDVAATFARQEPLASADPLAGYARRANYPCDSYTVAQQDVTRLGIRAFFFSNSCSAIRRDIFNQLGGFPIHTIMNEDMLFAARLLRAGERFRYVAEAVVGHSHNYTLSQTFRRYFDIGVVLAQAKGDLGNADVAGSGIEYVKGLIANLWQARQYRWIVAAVGETMAKTAGVTLGKRYQTLPRGMRRRLSMHRGYWA